MKFSQQEEKGKEKSSVSPIFPSLFLTGYLDKVDKGLQGLWL